MKHWLVAYDIKNPRRLRKIHRLLKKLGYSPTKKSIYGKRNTKYY